MRKQYRCTEGTWPAYRFSLYHDGKLVDSYSKIEGEIVDEHLRLESLGYTYGYTEEEVEAAYKTFEHRNDNLLLRADRIDILIANSSNEGDLVLDPFMGIGSAGVAAVNLNRNFIGIELDDGYFKIAKKRIENINK